MWRALLFAVTALAAFGCESDFSIWIPRTRSADPLYRFVKHGKAGYIDAQGKVVIPPILPRFGNYGSEFHDGLLEISVNDGKYVNASGKLTLDLRLSRGWDFSEGLAVAMREGEDLFGYIDKTGKFAISPRFSASSGYVYSFSDGYAMIQAKGRFGFIDHTGTFVIPPRFLDATSFADGIARVVIEGSCMYFPEGPCGSFNPVFPGLSVKNVEGIANSHPACKFSYINKSGDIITSQRFDYGRDFSEGLAPVKLDKLWGFIDKSGSLVIAPKFEDAEPFYSGLTRILANGEYGYADKSGQIVIAPQFKEAESFSEGLAAVSNRDGAYWYIDTHGRRSFQDEFALASPFFKGLAAVKLMSRHSEKFAYINTKGHVIFRY